MGRVLPFGPMSRTEARPAFRDASDSPGPIALLRQAIRDVVSRKRLIRYLAAAEMRKRGSDTILGNLWWILDPLLQMVVFVVFVTIIAQRPAPDYPLFILAAILPWKWFSAAITDATTSVVRQERLIRQIAFPKLVLPVATATAGVVGFAWGLVPLLGIMLLFADRISVHLLWIPLIAAVQYVWTLAVAILMSAANVFARDIGNVVSHVLRLWWLLSPGLYSLEALERLNVVQDNPAIATIAGLNPFAVLFEAYRSVIYGTPDGGPPGAPDLVALGLFLAASVVVLALCAILFKRVEPEFAKVL